MDKLIGTHKNSYKIAKVYEVETVIGTFYRVTVETEKNFHDYEFDDELTALRFAGCKPYER